MYDVSVPAINQHLKRIFDDGELVEGSVVKKYLITAADGKSYLTNHYNLQAIIAVGFKVNNERAVQFRKWAGQIVKDYTIQGWTMDVERLKKGTLFTDEYFERQLENIREIRLSERKFYQKVTDLYATAFDYDKDASTTKLFFQTVQNKLHYATHRHTAAELIAERADAQKEHMGLTSWENAPDGKIVKSDVSIAKKMCIRDSLMTEGILNYLDIYPRFTHSRCESMAKGVATEMRKQKVCVFIFEQLFVVAISNYATERLVSVSYTHLDVYKRQV